MTLASQINDLANRIGTELKTLGTTMAGKTSLTEVRSKVETGNPYRREMVLNLPIRFPNYAAVLAARGTSYLFPQGFCYEGSELFILYGGDGANPVAWVSVHNRTSGAYIRGFALDRNYGESIRVITMAGVRYLYMPSGTNMCRWNITTLPTEQAVVTPANTYNVQAFSHFDYISDQFIVQTRQPSDSALPKHIFTRWDPTFTTRKGEVRFNQTDQWTLAPDSLSLNMKAQNFCAMRSGFAVGYGGTYYADATVAINQLVGIKTFDEQGNVLLSGICNPNAFISTLVANGISASIIENEGVAMSGTELHALWVTHPWNVSAADTGGILITRELSGSMDFTQAGVAWAGMAQPDKVSNFVYTSQGSKLYSPIDGSELTTLESVIEMMRTAHLNRWSFYTTGATLPDFNGNALPTGSFCEIKTGNFASWEIRISGSVPAYSLWVTGSKGGPFTQGVVQAVYGNATAAASQSIPNGSETLVTPANSEVTGGMAYSGGTFTVPRDGVYMVSGRVSWTANATGSRIITLQKNGVTQARYSAPPSSAGQTGNLGVMPMRCSAGDTIRMRAYQSSGAALDILSDSAATGLSVTLI